MVYLWLLQLWCHNNMNYNNISFPLLGYSSNSSETFNLTEILYKSNNIFENIASSLLTNQPTVASSSIQAIQTSSPYFSTTSSLKLISSVSVSLSVSPSIQNTVSTETPSSLMVIIGGVVGGLFLVLILVLVLLMAIVIYYRFVLHKKVQIR